MIESKSYNNAFEIFTKAASSNNARALNALGACYLKGYGTAKSAETAIAYFLLATELRYGRSFQNLALCYLNGIGIERSYEMAFKYALEGAEIGEPYCMAMVGWLYLDGKGTEKNLEKGIFWLEKGVEHNDSMAKFLLAKVLLKGNLLSKNENRAIELLSDADKDGNIKARKFLTSYYFKRKCMFKNMSSTQDALGIEYADNRHIAVRSVRKSVNIIDLLDTTIAIADHAFMGNEMVQITIPKSVRVIGENPFCFCRNLEIINCLSESFIVDNHFFLSEDRKRLISYFGMESDVTVPDGVTYIDDNAFASTDIRTIHIPKTVKRIGRGAFAYSKNLQNINFEDGICCTIGSYCFVCCEKLEFIDLPEGMNKIPSCSFAGCKSLRHIVLPDSCEHIEYGAFALCEKLDDITLSNNLKVIGDFAFHYCRNLENIIIPKSVEKIGYNPFVDVQRITCRGNNFFFTLNGCLYENKDDGLNLKAVYGNDSTLILPNDISCISSYACFGLNIHSLHIPGTLKTIQKCAFYHCDDISRIQIDEGVTDIGDFAFRDTAISEITLPSTILSLGKGIFSDCHKLDNIYYNGDRPVINERILYSMGDDIYLHDFTDYGPYYIHGHRMLPYVGTDSYYENCPTLTIHLKKGIKTDIDEYCYENGHRVVIEYTD